MYIDPVLGNLALRRIFCQIAASGRLQLSATEAFTAKVRFTSWAKGHASVVHVLISAPDRKGKKETEVSSYTGSAGSHMWCIPYLEGKGLLQTFEFEAL